MIPGTQVGTSFLQIFPCRFEVSLQGDRWMASADWSAIPRTVLYTATNSRSFLLIPRCSLCVEGGLWNPRHFLRCLRVVRSFTQLRASKCLTTVYHFDNAPANGSLATETSICVSVVGSVLSSNMCYSVKTLGRPGYHHTILKIFVSYVHGNISSHVQRYGGFSSTFSLFTDSAGLLYLLPTFKESFV